MLENFFKLKENHTDVKTEVLAGITTFMTMAYILAVNPTMLSAGGMDATAVLIATCLAAFVGTLAMALLANYPFALAPGMGLNAYFAYTVCGTMGYSWKVALMAVFIEGIIFIVLSLTNVREAIFNAIPATLKKGVSAGIGLFIAFIGLQGAHIVVANDTTLLSYVKFTENWHTEGICALLALIGLMVTAVLYIKKVKASILIGILVTWILGMLCQATGIYHVDVEAGYYSLYPTLEMTDFSAITKTFGQCFSADFHNVGIFNFIVVLLSFLFVDMFDTLGTLIGVSDKAGMLDKDGKLPRVKQALLADAIATSAGAVLGTSTTTTFVESSAGVGAGAGIAYLCGGGYREIIHTVVNAVAIVSGMVCDGAKASCAAKIASSVDAGILGYYMYKNGQQFYGGDGLVTKGVEATLKNIGRLGKEGMKETNREIIRIMTEEPC